MPLCLFREIFASLSKSYLFYGPGVNGLSGGRWLDVPSKTVRDGLSVKRIAAVQTLFRMHFTAAATL